MLPSSWGWSQADLVTAYDFAAGQSATPIGSELDGQALPAGVYASGTFLNSGTLTLDAENDPDAVFIFQMGSSLTAASNSTVNLINGADACNVFWQVGSSATLGAGSRMVGTVMALTSIWLDTGATVQGRVLAREGEVTLDNNTITTAACTTPMDEDDTTGGDDATGDADTTGGDDTTDGDTTGGDTTSQIQEVPSGSVAAGGGVGSGSTVPGWMSLVLASGLLLGAVGIAGRHRIRA